jgi:uncharacterized protein (DUF885 family)
MTARSHGAILALLTSLGLTFATGAEGAVAATAPADAALRVLADDYIDNYYLPADPSGATAAGVHRYDTQLADHTLAGVAGKIRVLRRYLARVGAIDPASLSEWARGDRELLISSIRGGLLTLETARPLERDPDSYSSGISNAAFVLMERDFAPVDERLRLVVARELKMPAVLALARKNLRNPPEIYTRIALEQLPGIIGFFQDDLPLAFASAHDPAAIADFRRANARVVVALKDYEQWLGSSMLPRSHGDFRLGAKAFMAKLAAEEMVDIPLDRLLQIGMDDLRRNQREFARIARELEPDKSLQQVIALVAADHPAPGVLLDTFRGQLDGLVEFIEQHQIVTIPSKARPVLHETPPFMRATTSASLDTPGPLERGELPTFFDVTLPEASWDAGRTDEFMGMFNFPVITTTAIHEAYPGHYLQYLHMQRVDDRVRKLLWASSNAEGWAHYCEQMMLDEGYGQPGAGAADARAAALLRLGQLEDALLRDARFIVGIRLHTQRMSLDEAIQFFVSEGYQTRSTGEIEAKRGTSDPTYLYYTLGKLQIQKLRADVAAREGQDFRLRDFHDRFLQQGAPPIKIVRRALLGDDSPTL